MRVRVFSLWRGWDGRLTGAGRLLPSEQERRAQWKGGHGTELCSPNRRKSASSIFWGGSIILSRPRSSVCGRKTRTNLDVESVVMVWSGTVGNKMFRAEHILVWPKVEEDIKRQFVIICYPREVNLISLVQRWHRLYNGLSHCFQLITEWQEHKNHLPSTRFCPTSLLSAWLSCSRFTVNSGT